MAALRTISTITLKQTIPMSTDKQWEKSVLFWDNEMLAEFDRSEMIVKDFRELKLRDSSNLSDNQDKIDGTLKKNNLTQNSHESRTNFSKRKL
jgi:hypothetical protein